MHIFLMALLLLVAPAAFAAPAGTAFSYQGELRSEGANANGSFDFQFELYDALELGNPVGPSLQIDDVPVQNGIFTVQLDFGSAPFTGDALFLQISVRENAEPFADLTPRQELTPVPYAIHAASIGSSDEAVWTVEGSIIVSGDNSGLRRMDLLQVPHGIDLRFESLTISPTETSESPPTPHRARIQMHLVHQDDLEVSGRCPAVSAGNVPGGLFAGILGTSVTQFGQVLHLTLNGVLSPNWNYMNIIAQSGVSPFPEPIEEYTACHYFDTAGITGDRYSFQVYFSVNDHGAGFSLGDYWIGLVSGP